MRIVAMMLALGAVVWAQDAQDGADAKAKAADNKAPAAKTAEAKPEAKKAAPLPLSARLAKMDESCKKGCKVSAKVLAALQKETGAKTPADAIAAVKALEADAEKNAATLLKYEQVVWNAVPTSAKVKKYAARAKKGCKSSRKVVKGLLADFGMEAGPDFCTDKGAECEALLKAVTDVEVKAAKGDKAAQAQLDELAAKIPSPFAKAKAAGDCADCKSGDCNNCDATAKAESEAPAEPKQAAADG